MHRLQIHRCFASADVQGSVGAVSTNRPERKAALVGVSVALLGGAAWVFQSTDPFRKPSVEIDIKPISEEVFDTCDNLFVFFLDEAEELVSRREDIQRIIRAIVDEPTLHRVRFFYNVRKEGDPPTPAPSAGDTESESHLRAIMYKGQRKSVINIGSETPLQKVSDFFRPLSQDLSKIKAPKLVPFVSHSTFQEDIVNASSPRKMVLMQMYEDTCLLCFLMRPFVNSLAELLHRSGAPLVIKRLNIEKNDFPDNCPIARGTPTFVLFRGAEASPSKWEEFKPKELTEKIAKVFPQLLPDVLDQMEELQNLVTRRFQLFTQLVMWTIELQKLESYIAAGSRCDAAPVLPASAPSQDSEFNSVVSQMMAKDMKRIDGIFDNLKFLQQEVDEVEHDAVVLGSKLAELVLAREQLDQRLH